MTFTEIMKKLSIPANRQEATSGNAKWFLRHEAIKFRNHPLYFEAMKAAKDLATEK